MLQRTLALCGLLLLPALALVYLPSLVEPVLPQDESLRHLRWTAHLPLPASAWPDQTRMTFDRVPHPLLLSDRVVHGCTRTDSVVAHDRATGEELWRIGTDGPVRLPIAHWNGLLFAASDDGHIYALEAASGKLRWKMRGGPDDRKILGNERLISVWPVRGGPVVAPQGENGATVYFAAGIWPFMGIFLHAVDAETGTVRWTCDGEGTRYMKQPHNADAFAGVAPQGRLVVAGDLLLIPGGRSVPAAYNRHTGEFVHFRLADYGKTGNSEVQANRDVYLCGDSAYAVESGAFLGKFGDPCYLTHDRLFAWEKRQLTEYDVSNVPVERVQSTDTRGKALVRWEWKPRRLGSIPLEKAPSALVRQGDRLFVAQPGQLVALPLPLRRESSAPVWQEPLTQPVVSLTVDDRDIVAVTRHATLHVYGLEPGGESHQYPLNQHSWREDASVVRQAHEYLKLTGQRGGYALLDGAEHAGLARELVRQSDLRVILLVADAEQVDTIRTRAQAASIYGDRLTILPGTAETLDLPPYFANLIVLAKPNALEKVFHSVRPYGGVLALPPGQTDALRRIQPTLPVRETAIGSLLIRAGALPGAGNWTHEQGDAAGTRLSRDLIVKAPLGLLWYGGPSAEGVLPRHGHGPQPQVIDGRAIIEGMDVLRALDIYTGRLLWEKSLPGVGKLYDNLAHQPGANGSGGNYVSLSEGIYVVHGKHCLRLDPATGKELQRFALPKLPGVGSGAVWSHINVLGDYLVGGTLPDNPSKSKTRPAAPSSSKVLFVLDRESGKLLWSATAKFDGWRHNAICLGKGRLFAVDRPSPLVGFNKDRDRNKGRTRLVAFELATGREVWTADDIFGTSLAYSEEHDVLIEAGRVARDTLIDESPGMRAYTGATGKILWFQREFGGPCMVRGEQIFFGSNTSGKACDLKTGKILQRPDPLTGEPSDWTWARNYGCNTPMASEHLLTFRSGSAGFYDLCNESGTGNLGGFRSGCTNNLVVAGGLLVVPDYTRTCTCSYQNQCSVGLIPMPEADLWTFQGGSSTVKGVVRRMGLLLGGPGNRKADNGTLWLEYPSVGSPGPKPTVTIQPKAPNYFRRHPSQIAGEPNWAGASGAIGLQSLTVQLGPKGTPSRDCTVRLIFTEPEAIASGERVFDVALNGKTVLTALDVRQEAGASLKVVVREFPKVALADVLELRFTPKNADVPSVLSGIEIVQE